MYLDHILNLIKKHNDEKTWDKIFLYQLQGNDPMKEAAFKFFIEDQEKDRKPRYAHLPEEEAKEYAKIFDMLLEERKKGK
jgi:hypothetical protein